MSTAKPAKKPLAEATASIQPAAASAPTKAPAKSAAKPPAKPPAKAPAKAAAKSAPPAAKKPAVRKPAPTKPAPQKAAVSASEKPAKQAKPVVALASLDAKKAPRRLRLVRDSFTMPESDIALIGKLKTVALGAHRAAKKSELLRAGLHALAALDAKALVAALDALEAVKTGRPKKG